MQIGIGPFALQYSEMPYCSVKAKKNCEQSNSCLILEKSITVLKSWSYRLLRKVSTVLLSFAPPGPAALPLAVHEQINRFTEGFTESGVPNLYSERLNSSDSRSTFSLVGGF